MPKDYLRGVYDLETQTDTDRYYTEWAATYEEELTRNGYRTPARCAQALARFAPLDTPVLDVGCGTGMSGAALSAAGFSDISGQDVNAEMLEQARSLDLYRTLWVADPDDPFPFEPGTYGALTAIGVIGPGAGPATLLGRCVQAMAPGGHVAFSYNDLACETPEFVTALDDVIDGGLADQVFADRGPHIEALDSFSTIYVLRRN